GAGGGHRGGPLRIPAGGGGDPRRAVPGWGDVRPPGVPNPPAGPVPAGRRDDEPEPRQVRRREEPGGGPLGTLRDPPAGSRGPPAERLRGRRGRRPQGGRGRRSRRVRVPERRGGRTGPHEVDRG